MDIVVHDHDDGNRYLVFHVHQFRESPVLCRNNSPDTVRSKDRLAAGDVYVRPATGTPRTEKVTDAARLHDLLELAAEFRARRMLEIGKRIGLQPGETPTTLYDAELRGGQPMNETTNTISEITDIPVPVKDYPYWTLLYRPESYSPDLIPSLTECGRLVEKARVQLRGWDFPHLSHRETDRCHGSNWIGSSVSFRGNIEYWRLYQSGQFIHFAAVREAAEHEWRAKLQRETMSHLSYRDDIDWDAVPGYISLVNLVYTVTEYFEFAARICQAGVYRGGLDVSLELTGAKGFVLTTDWNRAWSEYRVATDDRLRKAWRLSSNELIVGSAEHSLKAIAWLCECFGWMSPNVEALRKDQEKLLSGHL